MALCVRLSTVARAAIASSGSIGFLQSRLTGLKSIASCNHVDNCFGLVGFFFFSFCLNMVSLRTRLKASCLVTDVFLLTLTTSGHRGWFQPKLVDV